MSKFKELLQQVRRLSFEFKKAKEEMSMKG